MAAALEMEPGQISVLPDTFDPEKFTPGPKPRFLLKRYGLRPEQPVILTIARLDQSEQYKGYDQVLRALPPVCGEFPDVRYVLGGRGQDRERVERLIRDLHLEENVTLAGYVAEHELREHYNLCDVFAMPSKGEGFGIVFLEALGCGKPVVAGNKDGSLDAVLGGRIGALVDPDDVQEIEAALIQLLRRSHPNPILRDPGELRREAIDAYGYDNFRARLEDIVAPFAKSG
jgi:glycosyltransferase involved in cell wall biosynthesis